MPDQAIGILRPVHTAAPIAFLAAVLIRRFFLTGACWGMIAPIRKWRYSGSGQCA